MTSTNAQVALTKATCAVDCEHKSNESCVSAEHLKDPITPLHVLNTWLDIHDTDHTTHITVQVPGTNAIDTNKYITIVCTDADRKVAQGMALRYALAHPKEKDIAPAIQDYNLQIGQFAAARTKADFLIYVRILGYKQRKRRHMPPARSASQ